MPYIQVSSQSLFTDPNLKYEWTMDNNSNSITGSQNGTDTNITYTNEGRFQGCSSGYFGTATSKITFGTVFNPKGISGSISMWVLPTANGVNGLADYLYTSFYTKGDIYGRIGIRNTNKVRIYYYDGNIRFFDGNTAIPTGSWTHIVYEWDASEGKIFINANADASSSFTMYNQDAGGTGTTTQFGRGPEASSGDYVFAGYIDDITFWNKKLTPTEILQIFNGPVSALRQQPIMMLI